MRMTLALLLGLLALSTALVGCSPNDITEGDAAQVKQEMSKEKYEEAMRAAGRGAELDAEKAEAERRSGDGG